MFQPSAPARAEEVQANWAPAAPLPRAESPTWHPAGPVEVVPVQPAPAAPALPAAPPAAELPPPTVSRPAPVTRPAFPSAAPSATVAQQPAPAPGVPPQGEAAVVQEEGSLSAEGVAALPGPQRLFRLESERTLHERIRQQKRRVNPIDKVEFPDEPVLSRSPYYGRRWPAQRECAEPNYVCYGRLLFEQKNLERYGWDLGAVTPFVSALAFYEDFVTLPYHEFTDPCRCFECSAGYCLPGDPVPLLLYPVEPSVSGALAEAAAVGAVLAIFP